MNNGIIAAAVFGLALAGCGQSTAPHTAPSSAAAKPAAAVDGARLAAADTEPENWMGPGANLR